MGEKASFTKLFQQANEKAGTFHDYSHTMANGEFIATALFMLHLCYHRRRNGLKSGTAQSSAEGARIEAPKAPRGMGSGEGACPLPSRLGGLGERRELPQRGSGRNPGSCWILAMSLLYFFVKYECNVLDMIIINSHVSSPIKDF